jgi:hypothetical protein
VNPGTNETNAPPTPVFSLTASATVDEGNNWINMRWGPLSLVNTSNMGQNGQTLGNYGPASDSSVIGYIAPTTLAGTIAYMLAPDADFYGTLRKTNNRVDAGAVEFVGGPVPTLTSIAPATGVRGATVPVTLSGTLLTGATAVNVSGAGVSCPITGTPTDTTVTANCTVTRGAALGARNVTVVTPSGTTNAVTFTVQGATIGFTGPTGMTTVPGNTNTKNGTITVNNTALGANAGPFTLTAAPAIAKTGGTGTGTATITGGTCVSGSAVNPGSSCTVTVRWVPSNTSTAQLTVTLAGTGTTTPTVTRTFSAN